MIEISTQYGDVISADVFGPMHLRLKQIFELTMRRDYGVKVTMLCIILRVSGELWDFGTEGPERLFYRRKGQYLEIDLAIPRQAWEEQPLEKVRRYLVDGLRETFAMLRERLVRVDKNVDIEAWQADFERCLKQFENEAGGAGGGAKVYVGQGPRSMAPADSQVWQTRSLKVPRAFASNRRHI